MKESKRGRGLGIVGVMIACFLALSSGAGAEIRSFTDVEGRTIEADLLDVEGGKVKLVLTSGRSVLVPVEKFSAGDQKFFTEWVAKNKSSVRLSALGVVIKRHERKEQADKEEIKKMKKDKDLKDYKRKSKFTKYTVTVENRTSEPIEDLKVKLIGYVNERERRTGLRMIEQLSEEVEIGTLGAKEEKVMETGEMVALDLTEVPKKGTEGMIRQSADTLGLIVEVYTNGVLHSKTPMPDNVVTYAEDYERRRKAIEEDAAARKVKGLGDPED